MPQFNLPLDRRQFVAAMAAVAASPQLAWANSPARPAFASLAGLVAPFIAEHQLAGMVVAVGRSSMPVRYFSAGTLALDSEAPTGPDTLFRIASMTKAIAACGVMLLIEDGRLGLDTPLAEIFPAYRQMHVLQDPAAGLEAVPAARPILIRHLLTHSAGFTYGDGGATPLGKLYADDRLAMNRRIPPEAAPDGKSGLLQFAAAAASLPLLFQPGAAYNYSIGLDIAGAVIEQVAGLPFEHFLRQRIFEPLGMVDSFFTVPMGKVDRLAASYRHSETGPELIERGQNSTLIYPPAVPSGGGGLVSTAQDYARFCAMLLAEGEYAGVRVMQADTARLMMSDLLEPGVTAVTGFGATGHGAGGRWTRSSAPGGEGKGTYGWMGAHQTFFWVDRANDVYAVIMTQRRSWWPNPIPDLFGKALYADLALLDNN